MALRSPVVVPSAFPSVCSWSPLDKTPLDAHLFFLAWAQRRRTCPFSIALPDFGRSAPRGRAYTFLVLVRTTQQGLRWLAFIFLFFLLLFMVLYVHRSYRNYGLLGTEWLATGCAGLKLRRHNKSRFNCLGRCCTSGGGRRGLVSDSGDTAYC